MKFNFFKKNKEEAKVLVRISKRDSAYLVKEQFSQLTKRSLALPVTLYQL